jgi:chorismate mutase
MTTSAAEAPPAAGLEQDDPIPTLRHQIDALDAAIAQLIVERAQLSRRVQAARLDAGGTRVALGRERAIHQRYRAALGNSGSAVAESILRACRGTR